MNRKKARTTAFPTRSPLSRAWPGKSTDQVVRDPLHGSIEVVRVQEGELGAAPSAAPGWPIIVPLLPGPYAVLGVSPGVSRAS